jgi:flagellar basal body-associated protein FliL
MNLHEKTRPEPDRKGKHMIIMAIVAVTLLVAALAGVLALVRLGISREEREDRFSGEAQTRISAATRAVTGLYVRTPERADDANYATNGTDADQGR